MRFQLFTARAASNMLCQASFRRRQLPSAHATDPLQIESRTPAVTTKSVLDSLLLRIPGVEAGELSGLPAYFIKQKMFACVHREAVAIRLPVAAATELQFSRADVTPFQPNGKPSTREWIQLNHADPDEYRKDVDLFNASIEFVKAAKAR